MPHPDDVTVHLPDGRIARVHPRQPHDSPDMLTLVLPPDGQQVNVPAHLIHRDDDGRLLLTADPVPGVDKSIEQPAAGQTLVVPLAQERLVIGKQTQPTEKVSVHITPQVHQQVVDVPLSEQHVHVERVPVNRLVDAPEPVRQQGNVTIVPIMEEVLVVQKRLRVKEELHIRREQRIRHHTEQVTLRREQADVQRQKLTDPDAQAH